MYALKTDRQIKDKVRKEKCSAINTTQCILYIVCMLYLIKDI